MTKSAWYSVRPGKTDVIVTKIDGDKSAEYHVSADGRNCDCYAGNRPTCRHRLMAPKFIGRPSGTLYNYDLDQWKEPENPDEEPIL